MCYVNADKPLHFANQSFFRFENFFVKCLKEYEYKYPFITIQLLCAFVVRKLYVEQCMAGISQNPNYL